MKNVGFFLTRNFIPNSSLTSLTTFNLNLTKKSPLQNYCKGFLI